jgi:tripartite ATP-independent transporter DctM subunit
MFPEATDTTAIATTEESEQSIRFPDWIEAAFDWFLALILAIQLVALFGNVITRSWFDVSFDGANEVAALTLMTLAFVGGAIAYHRGEHISVRYLVDQFPPRAKRFVEIFSIWTVLGLSVVGLILDFPAIVSHWKFSTAVLEIPNGITYIPFAAGTVLLIVFTLRRLVRHGVRDIFLALAATALLFAFWYLLQSVTGPWKGPGAFLFLGIVLFAGVFLGVPIAFVLNLVAYLFLKSTNLAAITAIPPAMISGISGFILLAIPFFILAGHLMTEGGLTRPLSDWVCALIGHVRAGLFHVLVISMYIFSGISGSKLADVAAVGTAMRDMLKEKGYDRAEFTSILAASAIMGETIPPSLAIMVLGSVTVLSVGTMFAAGILPAVVMSICIMAYIAVKGYIKKWPKAEKAPWSYRLTTTIKAVPVFLVPVILVVGIVGGLATPTEVSSFAVIYAILVGTLLYRFITLKDLVRIFAHSAVSGGMILYIISAAAALSWVMTVASLPSYIISLLDSLGGTSTVFLIFSLVLLVVMGSVLEGAPCLLIFGPLLVPIAIKYGIDGTHFGIVMILAMGMGTFMPPLGVGFFVSSAVGECSLEEAAPKYLQYIVALVIGLLLVTFVPEISLWLPRQFNMQ